MEGETHNHFDMAEKKLAPKKRSSAKKPLDKVEKDESRATRQSDHPIKSAVALGVVAVLIGLTIGGYLASRYFEQPVEGTSTDEARLNELAQQLAQQILEEEATLDPEEIRGYTQTVVPASVSDGAGNEVAPEPTHMRYVNDFYGVALEFPVAWAVDASVEVRDAEVHLATIASNEIEMRVRVAKYDERSFKRAVEARVTTQEEVYAAVEAKRAEFARLFPENIDAFSLSVETTSFGHEARRIDGHDAFVDWYAEPVLEGEPARVRRRFYIDNGRGTMFVVSMSFPVEVGADSIAGGASSNPFSDLLDVVMDTWRFTNDGIGDDADMPVDSV